MSNEGEESSIYDDVKAAMEATETRTDEAGKSSEADEVSNRETGPTRGPDGRFVSTQGEKEVDTAKRLEPAEPNVSQPVVGTTDKAGTVENVPSPTQEGTWNQDKPPQSWIPSARERWQEIPEDLRKEIVRREEASVQGVRQLQERYGAADTFIRSIAGVVNDSLNRGVEPSQHINAVMRSEAILRTASTQDKFQEVLRIAEQYGVPLKEVINASVGQEVIKSNPQAAQIPPQIAQELQEIRQWRRDMEYNNVTNTVNAFGADKEFFTDVRTAMADLVEGGIAQSLEEAYDRACWMNPEIRTIMLSRQAAQAAGTTVAQRQKAATGVSLPPNGKLEVADEEDVSDDLTATVRQAYNRSVNGRI